MIGLVVVAAAATYLYIQQPKRAVANAVQKISEAQTQRFEAVIGLDNPAATQALLQNASKLTITLDGSFDRRRQERDSLVTNVFINAETEGVKLELEGELRFIDDKAYVLVKKSPAAIPLLAALKETWVELPRGETAETPGEPGSEPLFTSVDQAGREKVGETSAVKYEVKASQRAIVGFMGHVAQLLGTRLTDEQVSALRGNLAGIEELPATLWITPMSHELVQLETRLGDTGTRYTIKFGERNQPVDHAIPEGVKPIQEVLSQKES